MANSYTFSVLDAGDLVTATVEAEIARCAQYVIDLVGRYLDWKGTLDFVVEIRPAAELTWSDADGLLPSYTQIAWNGAGWTNLTLAEALTGFDADPGRFDAGCTIYLADDGSIKNYGSPVWFDPDPRFGVDPAVPAGTHDFVGIYTHEIFHSLGFNTHTDQWRAQIFDDGERAYFNGANAAYWYGGRIPFARGTDHYGFSADPAVGISRGLMFEWGNYERNRLDIGRIDLAILADLGLDVKSYDGLSLFELLDTDLDLAGGDGDDRLYGDYHVNALAAGSGDDLLDGGAGADTMTGGAGNDLYFVDDAGDAVAELAGQGDDEVRTGLVALTLAANVETLIGLAATGQTLTGNALDNRLVGGAGDDRLDGGPGADRMEGHGGFNIHVVDDALDVVVDGGGFDQVETGLAAYALGAGIEKLVGLAATGQQLAGNALANPIHGGIGDDEITGGDGDDYLHGGDGHDRLDGGPGDDWISAGIGNDVILMSAGTDIAHGEAGDDRIEFSASDVATAFGSVAQMGAGFDHLVADLGGFTTPVLIDRSGLAPGSYRVEIISGSVRLLQANEVERVTATTGSGNDIVRPIGNADIFATGAGDDFFNARGAGDRWNVSGQVRVDLGAGYDRVEADWSDLDAGQAVVWDTADPAGIAFGSGESERYIRGAEFLHFFYSGAGADRITLHAGPATLPSQTVRTHDGDDIVTARFGATAALNGRVDLALGNGTDGIVADFSAATEAVTGFAGAYALGGAYVLLVTGHEHLTLIGGSAADVVRDSIGDDWLQGGLGDDLLGTEQGRDRADGGGGDDRLEVRYAHVATNLVLAVADTAGAQGGYDGTLAAGGHAVAYSSIEHFDIETWLGDDRVVTLGGDDVIRTGWGQDVLDGGAGNDLLDGGVGDDFMAGGLGDDVYEVDSLGDTVIEQADGGIDTVRTSLGSRADPVPVIYIPPAGIENLIGTLGAAQQFEDNALDNVITTANGADFVYAMHGGNDTVATGAGNDFLFFGATFDNVDRVDGGAGTDRLGLYGDYVLTFAAGSLAGIERLMLYSAPGNDFDYDLATLDGALAAGARLEVGAQSLGAGETLAFDGSAETDGSFWIRSGDGDDDLAGGALADRFSGGRGADRLTGNGGGDRFDVTAVDQSTGPAFDTFVGFDAGEDRINIAGTIASFTVGQDGALSTIGFDAALAALVDDALGVGGATRVDATGGEFANRTFVVVDANGDGVYSAGSDYVFAFEAPVQENLEAFPIFS
jgi:Ca2+-binding RTX toxin-like protein